MSGADRENRPWVGVEEILLAKEGDRTAFARLVEVFTPVLLAHVRGYENNPQEAADLVQETWLKAYRQIGHLTDPEKFGSWLLSVAKHTHIDRLRRGHRNRPIGSGDSLSGLSTGVEKASAPGPSPSEAAMVREEAVRILATIDRVGERYAPILRLRLLHDHSTSAIASLLHLKESTVRMRLKRGLEKVRRILEKEGFSV